MLLLCSGCYAGVSFVEVAAQTDGASNDDPETGEPDSEPSPADDAPPASCNGNAGVAPRPLQRLSPIEYQNTMRDLLGDAEFVAEYDSVEDPITERGVRQLRNGAETALLRREQWTHSVFDCDLDAADDACAMQFIDAFAPRVFRRPLRDDERTWLEGMYSDARQSHPASEALGMLAQAVLQAPPMMYREEAGSPVAGAPDEIRRLDGYEMASRLSYLLWDTLPDDVLFEAAEDGRLQTTDGLTEQLDRMLADPRTETKVQGLVWSWLQLDGGEQHYALEETMKDPTLFAEFDGALQDAMRTEIEALVTDVFENQEGSIEALLTTPRAYVNRSLADLYGVSGPIDDSDWQWVDLPQDQRSGLLTRAGFLAVYAGPRVQSPIRRGVSIVEDLLCQELAPPPPNVNDVPPEGSSGANPQTVREAVEAQTSVAQCAGCHSIINPFGFTLEHYDAIGRWQTTEVLSGGSVDSAADIAFGGVQGTVADGVELSAALANNENVRECLARYWFEQAIGGELGELDECEVQRVADTFTQTGDMRELLREIVLSNTFRFVNTSPVEGDQ